MKRAPRGEVTELLSAWSEGDEHALADLIPLVYEELRTVASSYLRKERQGHTLGATALVHEAYLRLADKQKPRWKDRSHFFATAARIMRWALIDYARRRRYPKRGGGVAPQPLDDALHLGVERAKELVSLDEALSSLDRIDPSLRRIVDLRFFAGLSIQETALALGVSDSTVKREWRLARAWLYGELGCEAAPEEAPR